MQRMRKAASGLLRRRRIHILHHNWNFTKFQLQHICFNKSSHPPTVSHKLRIFKEDEDEKRNRVLTKMMFHIALEDEESEELEVESVDIQCGVNVEDVVNVEDGVNVKDGLNVEGEVNSGSRLEEPYIGKLFDDVEDAQAFYKAYARRVGFAIRTNHSRLSKDDKKLCAVDYVCTREGFRQKYGVTPYGKDTPVYHVTLESGEDVATCTCHKWEFMGILCKHILCVFGKKGKLDRLPQHYVLERWTINAKSRPIADIPIPERQVRVGLDELTMRKNKSMIQFYDIVELGSQSQEKHNHLTHALQKVHKELLALEDHVETQETHYSEKGETCNDDQILRSQVVSNFSQTIQDPPRVPTKG
ncbi:hypothetical protein Q3G72_000582 [Acer saccharum]|nr:hypothetical protein Q3G72_000582 [Acer saccharum]